MMSSWSADTPTCTRCDRRGLHKAQYTVPGASTWERLCGRCYTDVLDELGC
jgi:hypothetical protein